MTDSTRHSATPLTTHRLRTPRSAAVAGIVFAVLTFTSMALLQSAIPADPPTDPGWMTDDENQVMVAVTLVPFAAIAFLWFVGVLRDLLGPREDQFFGTVFLGSGLLFVAGLFVWIGAIAAALASSNFSPVEFADSPAYVYAGSFIKVMGADVVLRMAGIFMFSSATMWSQTEVMPRWLVVLTYLGALVLLIGGPSLGTLRTAFPLWVLIASIVILVVHRRATAADGDSGATE